MGAGVAVGCCLVLLSAGFAVWWCCVALVVCFGLVVLRFWVVLVCGRFVCMRVFSGAGL